MKEPDLHRILLWTIRFARILFCCPSIFAQTLRAAIVAAELPLCGKLRAEAINVFIDQRIVEVIKKEANNRQA